MAPARRAGGAEGLQGLRRPGRGRAAHGLTGREAYRRRARARGAAAVSPKWPPSQSAQASTAARATAGALTRQIPVVHHHHREGDARVVGRREPHEPGVVPERIGLGERPGLAGHGESLHRRLPGAGRAEGASPGALGHGGAHHRGQLVGDLLVENAPGLHGGARNGARRRGHDVRRHEDPAVRDDGGHHGAVERRQADRAEAGRGGGERERLLGDLGARGLHALREGDGLVEEEAVGLGAEQGGVERPVGQLGEDHVGALAERRGERETAQVAPRVVGEERRAHPVLAAVVADLRVGLEAAPEQGRAGDDLEHARRRGPGLEREAATSRLPLGVLGHGQHPTGAMDRGAPRRPTGTRWSDSTFSMRSCRRGTVVSTACPAPSGGDVMVGHAVEGCLGEAELGGGDLRHHRRHPRGRPREGRGLELGPTGEDESPARGVDTRGRSRPGEREEEEEGPEGGEQPGGEAGPGHRDIGIVVEGWHTVKEGGGAPR